jgi:ABC-2 type transport system ATP-binding protein
VFPDFKVRHVLRAASWFYPNWSGELAETLLRDFDLPPNRAIKKLSRGMRSALGIVIGLAAQAEITLFDEPYAGLDAVARRLFYDRLLASYAANPSTVVLSTHLIDEVADLLERVVMIDHGRIVLDATADEVRGSATTVSGPIAAVEEFTAGRRTWDRRRVASQESVVVAGTLVDVDWARARELRLNLDALSLQQVMVHAAGEPSGDEHERTNA